MNSSLWFGQNYKDRILTKSPRVVEIVGVAGAGKTTLLLALKQSEKKIHAISQFRRLDYVPFFLVNAVLLLPTIFRVYRIHRRLSWRVIRIMIHLTAMHHTLERDVQDRIQVILLDQGPVYMLACLQQLGFDRTQDSKLEAWWKRILNYWMATLNTIVWIDAPNEILLQRIRIRRKKHSIKTRAEKEAHTFLSDFRLAYGKIMAEMTTNHHLNVICFDTSREPPDQIAAEIRQTILVGAANT